MIKYKADHIPLKMFFLGLKRRLRDSRPLLPESDLEPMQNSVQGTA